MKLSRTSPGNWRTGLTRCDLHPWPNGPPPSLQVMVGTAYFGHALLAELLLPKLKASAPARIVWMSGALEAQAKLRWDDLGCAWKAAAMVAYVLDGVCNMCEAPASRRRHSFDETTWGAEGPAAAAVWRVQCCLSPFNQSVVSDCAFM